MANPNPKTDHLKKFKKGVSGNPEGRTPILPLEKDIITEVATETPDVNRIKKIYIRLFELAEKGNVKAAEIIFERLWGKATQQINQDVKIDQPYIINIIEQPCN